MIKEEFGQKLRQQRRQAQMSQEQLALNSDIALRFVQEIEAGNQQPTITTLFKLSSGLGVTPDKLIMPVWDAWQRD